MEACSCLAPHEDMREAGLESFAHVRWGCPALRELFVPDAIWPDFQQWHQQPDLQAQHRSTLLLAMKRGYLGRLTSGVHRYLMSAGSLKPDVRRQYRQDLRERWMFYADPIKRHEQSRIFAGRVAEIHIAEWLEAQGWTVSGLEALHEGPDMEADAPDARHAAFEVKHIGTDKEDFGQILESLAGRDAGGPVSPYDAINYLLLRVYEAAKQLQKVTCDRIAVVVVVEMSWWRFEPELRGRWIDWAHPRFLSGHDPEGCLARQHTRYPGLLDDLQAAIGSLNAIWIVRQFEGYQYHCEYEI